MQYKRKLFVMLSAVLVLCTTNVNAETTATKPPCKTEIECTKLSDALQAQIDELEAKGIENLTEKEFNKYDALSDELSAVKDSTLAIAKEELVEAKAKTAEAKAEHAKVKAKLAEQKELIEQNKRILEMLHSIKSELK